MKSKLSWIAYIPFALSAFFFKFAQVLLPEGTVFGLSSLVMEYLYIGSAVMVFVLSLIFCLTDKKTAPYYVPHRNFATGIFGLMLAILFAADGADTLMRIFGSGKIETLPVMNGVVSLLAAIVFIVFALSAAFRVRENKPASLFGVIPALLFGVRMIITFVQFTTISVRLADVSLLICYMFAALFFFNYAQVLSRIEAKGAVKACFFYGLPAAAMLLPYAAYRLFTGFDAEILLNNVQPVELLVLGLYTLAFVIELTVCVKDRDSIEIIDDSLETSVSEDDQVEGFIAGSQDEDENDDDSDMAYLNTSDTSDYLYQEIPQDPQKEALAAEAEADKDIDGYLTSISEDASEAEPGVPKDYESSLDEIDKLIIDINRKLD